MNSRPISCRPPKDSGRARHVLRWKPGSKFKVWFWGFTGLAVIALCALIEIKTSLLQSWIFTSTNARMTYTFEEGKSVAIAFPRSAPFDDRRGYSQLARFQARLESLGYSVARQVRQSETLTGMIDRGISPPYPELASTGIEIRGADDTPLFRYAQSEFLFRSFHEIPPLIVRSLLFLENRELEHRGAPWRNPAIEWDRLVKAAFTYLGARLFQSSTVQGGSTLAVQLEKFRHSPSGRTHTPVEKLRQVIGASLKAYRAGPNTRAWREQIIADYLNTVPLAAAPGYGEIHGLGEGLHAWFGMSLADVTAAINAPEPSGAKIRAYKHVLSLLISLRAPSVFLIEERSSLEEKVNRFTRLMAKAKIIDGNFANALLTTPIQFASTAPLPPQPSSVNNKAANAIRTALMEQLNVSNLYDLNRLHLEIASTIDVPLQKKITEFLHGLRQPGVISAHGLNAERLLEGKDPTKVVYSVLLVESAANGNLVRVQADNLLSPLDFNKSVKLELGSTAKLRTITHYLELIAELHKDLATLESSELKQKIHQARDPLTRWVAETLSQDKATALHALLDRAMERKYSASPYEDFFTGGGLHRFENYDPLDDERVPTLREALRNSTNLAFIRLMRDIVAYHRARLWYDADTVLSDIADRNRQRLINEIAEADSLAALRRAYRAYRGQSQGEIVNRLLAKKANPERHLAVLFFAWKIGADEQALAAWLEQHGRPSGAGTVSKLFRAFQNPRLTLADYAYLLSRHPLDIWCAGEYRKNPELSWNHLLVISAHARRVASAWLINPRNRRAQDLRLRIRIEQEAFDRMVPYWQALGFPFKTMVPSYATAIGSSSDRPTALAELLGILVNDGLRRQTKNLSRLHFARGTPYETLLERTPLEGQPILPAEVARAVRKAMAEVVEQGTARRLSGVFKLANGKPLVAGGKTGSGDNRFETFDRSGNIISSRATNRTAAFVFYIGDRYYGVITAYVQGQEAGDYRFTSALPVTVLKLLAPAINEKLDRTALD